MSKRNMIGLRSLFYVLRASHLEKQEYKKSLVIYVFKILLDNCIFFC